MFYIPNPDKFDGVLAELWHKYLTREATFQER